MKSIIDLKEISKKDILIAGGKGASLGELVKLGMTVPVGFVVSAQAFETFLEKADINVEIRAIWNKINIKDMVLVKESSEILRHLILEGGFPEDLGEEIFKAFDNLRAVAVRSSATTEDSKIDSWAGELETYLNTTRGDLLENVKKCWASLYTPRAIFYRIQRKLKYKPTTVAVVIQKMVKSDASGVCFTVHPVTKDKNQMIIEAVWGLGELLVSGRVTPDNYVLEKSTLNILDININPQNKMIVQVKKGNKTTSVPKSRIEKQKLSEEQIKKLAKLCLKIENHFKTPQDVEWALEEDKFYILQSRAITTL